MKKRYQKLFEDMFDILAETKFKEEAKNKFWKEI